MAKKRFIIAIVFIAFLLSNVFTGVHASALEVENQTLNQNKYLYNAVVTASGLNVRSEPTINSLILGSILRGGPIKVLEEIVTDDEVYTVWLEIEYLDTTGYVSANYVNFVEFEDFSKCTYAITTPSFLNMREEPTTESRVVARLRKGTNITILSSAQTDDYYETWYEIDYNDKTGWVAGTYVDTFNWKLISQVHTTSHNSSANRNHNMQLACSTLNGTVILPGKTFSWVKTMGSCSKDKGYLQAPVYVRGNLVDGYGGGVCQVSTTINIAAKSVGIATKARAHSGRVSYASIEDEATVSYPYVDFSFKNTLDTPILLELVSSNGTVFCNVYTQD